MQLDENKLAYGSRSAIRAQLGVRFRLRVSANEQGDGESGLPYSVDPNRQCAFPAPNSLEMSIDDLPPIDMGHRGHYHLVVSRDTVYGNDGPCSSDHFPPGDLRRMMWQI